MVKKPSQQALNRAAVTVEQAEVWLSALRINHTARRKNPNQKNNVGRQSLGESMLVTIEDLALRNKRNGKDPKM
ncbi:CopG family transcriptional regulator [Escherichia coli]|uniref:CopG family transcriptional regulator n=1 Tax=Escherichia coli TaxID=562 RepID=UPI001EE0317C|nr:CopG family transcriptional regulator [Escherichia coli]GJH64865.1 hypothetical protein ECZC04_54250 [Escherichia coli]